MRDLIGCGSQRFLSATKFNEDDLQASRPSRLAAVEQRASARSQACRITRCSKVFVKCKIKNENPRHDSEKKGVDARKSLRNVQISSRRSRRFSTRQLRVTP